MVTLAGLQNVVAGGGGNDGQGDGVARGAAIRGWTLKSTRRVATTRERGRERERQRRGRRVGSERDGMGERKTTQENLRPPVNSYRTSYRVRARARLAHVRRYALTRAKGRGARTHASREWYIASENSRTPSEALQLVPKELYKS